MNFFISGGAGFIGSHISKFLLENYEDSYIFIYDNLSSGTLDHIHHLILKFDKRITFIEADIKDKEKLISSMSKIDVVIHLAANPDISKAVQTPDIDFWEGTYLTQNILEGIRLNNIKYLLYTSGSGVYGEVSGQEFNESYGPCYPISTYGASKLGCEALISSYCGMFGLFARSFRFANVVGPKQTHGVGYDFIRKLKLNPRELEILGDGTQNKSYIHISDVVSAIFVVYENMLKSNVVYDVFNVASEDYITVNEIASIACNILGIDFNKINIKYTGGDRGWKGDVPSVLFNTRKIKDLGWVPTKNSFNAIKESIFSMSDEI